MRPVGRSAQRSDGEVAHLGPVRADPRQLEQVIQSVWPIVEKADARGYPVRSPRTDETRAGTVTIQPDHAYEVSRELLARQFVIDYREGAGIRIAPHFYTADEELEVAAPNVPDDRTTIAEGDRVSWTDRR